MMNPNNPGRGSSWASDDDMMVFSLIVIVLGIGLFGYLAWSSYHGEISAAVIEWRRWQIGLLSRFTGAFAAARPAVGSGEPLRRHPWRPLPDQPRHRRRLAVAGLHRHGDPGRLVHGARRALPVSPAASI